MTTIQAGSASSGTKGIGDRYPSRLAALLPFLIGAAALSTLLAASEPSPAPTAPASPAAAPASPAAAPSTPGAAPSEDEHAEEAGESQLEGLGTSGSEKGTYSIAAGETVVGDRYFIGKDVTIDGTLDGDLFACGSRASVAGMVTGDVHVLGKRLELTGTAKDDVRVLAGEIDARGPIGGDLLAGGQEIRIQKTCEIGGKTSAFGAEVILDGTFHQNVRAGGGQVEFGGNAERDVDIESDVLSFRPGAHIRGNLTYTSSREIESLKEGGEARGMVEGSVTFVPKAPKSSSDRRWGQLRWMWEIWCLSTALLTGWILIAIARRTVGAILETTRTEPMRAVGVGLLGHIFAPFAALILMVLCLTLPLGLLVLATWGMLFYLSKLAVATALGDWLLRRIAKSPSPYLALLVGILPVWILCNLPFVGAFVYYFIVPVLGIGAILIGIRARSGGPARSGPSGPLPLGPPPTPSAPIQASAPGA